MTTGGSAAELTYTTSSISAGSGITTCWRGNKSIDGV
jgi:hypothetical protein